MIRGGVTAGLPHHPDFKTGVPDPPSSAIKGPVKNR
jgi:hypothetical protein